jgi:molecular chaperone GrpE
LLPVLDDMVRSLRAAKEGTDSVAFIRGVELIYAKLLKTLENQGLAAFESVGMPFDVGFHDALLQVPRDDVPPHTVVEEIERGYRFNDRVLRHARVIVSSSPEEKEAANKQPDTTPEAGTDT